MASPASPLEWDAQGRPIPQSGPGQEWDAQGNPINQPHDSAPVGDLSDRLSLMDRLEEIRPDDSRNGLGQRAANFVGNIGATGIHTLHHPIDSLSGMVKSLLPGSDTPNPIQSTYEGLNTHPADTIAQGIGSTAATMGMGEAAAPVMDVAGTGLKSLAGKVGKIATGGNAEDTQFGAQPGRAVSENRVVAMSKPGLKLKIDRAIPKLAADRDAILAKSTAGPQDIRQTVDQPFDTLMRKVTDPKTGVADPAEIRKLSNTRIAAHYQQDPFTGQPMADPVTHEPIPKDLEHMSPSEMAAYNSNLRDIGNYVAKDSPLSDQAVKGAGHGIREQLAKVVPESVDATRQLYNSETAQDILKRRMKAEEGFNPRSATLAGMVKSNLAEPATMLASTAAASGLDIAGSGLKSLAAKISPPAGPPPAGASAPDYSVRQAAPSPQLGAGQPPAPPSAPSQLPGGTPLNPPALPQTAGPTMDRPSSAAPPNVTLRERVGTSALPPRPGQPAPVSGTGGLQGPEGKVTTRTPTGFGPKVEAPGFTIPKKKLAARTRAKEK